MIDELQDIRIDIDCLTRNKAVEALWEWRKYRNQVFWGSIYRWGGIALLLTIVPYLLPNLEIELGPEVLVFPILAAFLSIVAAYLVAYQYMLYKQVTNKHKEVLGKYCPEDIPNTSLMNRAFRIAVGKIMAIVFLTFGTVGQLVNAWALLALIARGDIR